MASKLSLRPSGLWVASSPWPGSGMVAGVCVGEGSLSSEGEDPGVSSRLWPALTKWFSLPRLETRTKESNMPASTGVFKPPCAVKVNAGGKPQGGTIDRPCPSGGEV